MYIVSCQYGLGEGGEKGKMGRREGGSGGEEIIRKYIKMFIIGCQNFNLYPSNMQFIASQ